MPMNISEATVDTVMSHCEFLVINAENMKDCGVHIVTGGSCFTFPAPTVALSK